MIKKIAFTMYPVLDMIRARYFYEQTLGLTVGNVIAEGAWVEYDLPQGGCLALTTLATGVVPNENAGGSIAFEVDDIDRLMARLKDMGVAVKLDIFTAPTCKIAVILDSEGNPITLHQLIK